MLRFLLANTLGAVLERPPGGRDYQNGADSGPAASVLRVLRVAALLQMIFAYTSSGWRRFHPNGAVGRPVAFAMPEPPMKRPSI